MRLTSTMKARSVAEPSSQGTFAGLSLSPRPTRERIAVVVCTCLALTSYLLISNSVERWLVARERAVAVADVGEAANFVAASLQREIVKLEVISRAVAAALERGEIADLDGFAEVVQPLVVDSPSILNVGVAPGDRVEYVYPLAPNRAALGFDYRTNPAQYDSILHVRATGRTVLAGPFELVQGGTALILRAPYLNAPGAGAGQPLGIISVVVDHAMILEQVLGSMGSTRLAVAIRNLDHYGPEGAMIFGDPAVFGEFTVHRVVEFREGRWEMGFLPAAGWPATSPFDAAARSGIAVAVALIWILIFALGKVTLAKRRTETQLRSAIESIDDGFALYDSEDRFVFANGRYHELYARSSAALKPGTLFRDILLEGLRNGQYPEAVGREEAWLEERLAAHRDPGEPVIQRIADGRWLKVAETRTPDGNTVGFRVDITELRQAQERAEAANRAKSDFLNLVSHELRSPLSAVIGYARILENPHILPGHKDLRASLADPAVPAAGKTALRSFEQGLSEMALRIVKSGDHLLNLINDVLDGAKLEAGTLSVRIADLATTDLVDAVLRDLEQAARDKGLALRREVEAFTFPGDKTRMRQVLTNLVGNAIKFTDRGTVTVTARRQGDSAVFTVQDTGRGIRPEDIPRLFERFTQLDSSLTRQDAGTGLGLSITRDLVRLHDGEIAVESVFGTGTTFTVTLPLVSARQSRAA